MKTPGHWIKSPFNAAGTLLVVSLLSGCASTQQAETPTPAASEKPAAQVKGDSVKSASEPAPSEKSAAPIDAKARSAQVEAPEADRVKGHDEMAAFVLKNFETLKPVDFAKQSESKEEAGWVFTYESEPTPEIPRFRIVATVPADGSKALIRVFKENDPTKLVGKEYLEAQKKATPPR